MHTDWIFRFIYRLGIFNGNAKPDNQLKNFLKGITMRTLLELLKNQNGATAIEYALIAALVAVAAVASLKAVGTGLATTFNNVTGNLNGAR